MHNYDFTLRREYKEEVYRWMFNARKYNNVVMLTAPGVKDIKYGLKNGNLNANTKFTIVQNNQYHLDMIKSDLKGIVDDKNITFIKGNVFRTLPKDSTYDLIFLDTCGYCPANVYEWLDNATDNNRNCKIVSVFQLSARSNFYTERTIAKEKLFNKSFSKYLPSVINDMTSKNPTILKVLNEEYKESKSIIKFDQQDVMRFSLGLYYVLNSKKTMEETNYKAAEYFYKDEFSKIESCILSNYEDRTFRSLLYSTSVSVYNYLQARTKGMSGSALVYQYNHLTDNSYKLHTVPFICLSVEPTKR